MSEDGEMIDSCSSGPASPCSPPPDPDDAHFASGHTKCSGGHLSLREVLDLALPILTLSVETYLPPLPPEYVDSVTSRVSILNEMDQSDNDESLLQGVDDIEELFPDTRQDVLSCLYDQVGPDSPLRSFLDPDPTNETSTGTFLVSAEARTVPPILRRVRKLIKQPNELLSDEFTDMLQARKSDLMRLVQANMTIAKCMAEEEERERAIEAYTAAQSSPEPAHPDSLASSDDGGFNT